MFDSGVGGLSVLREIRRLLPDEALLYVADSGHAPYGDRAAGFVEARAMAITEFLLSCEAKAIVVACNTATSIAVAALRSRFALPIVAMEPAVKPAVRATRTGVVGVLATSNTLSGANVARLIAEHGSGAEILTQACPGLVECVEAGELDGERVRGLVASYIAPLRERGADTLVLGCTHYPFLAAAIRDAAGPGVSIIDPATAVARQLQRRLGDARLLEAGAAQASERFWSSGPLEQARAVIRRLWNAPVEVEALPSHERIER